MCVCSLGALPSKYSPGTLLTAPPPFLDRVTTLVLFSCGLGWAHLGLCFLYQLSVMKLENILWSYLYLEWDSLGLEWVWSQHQSVLNAFCV